MGGSGFRLDGFHCPESDVVRPGQQYPVLFYQQAQDHRKFYIFIYEWNTVHPHHLDIFRSFPVCKFLF